MRSTWGDNSPAGNDRSRFGEDSHHVFAKELADRPLAHRHPFGDDEPGPGPLPVVDGVQVGRIALLETIVDWRPDSLLSYTVEGLPPIAGSIVTTWQLADADGVTKTTVTTTVASRPNPVSRFVGRALGRQLGRAAKQMLSGLAAKVEAAKVEETAQ